MHFLYILCSALLVLTALAQPTGSAHAQHPEHLRGTAHADQQRSDHRRPQGSAGHNPQDAGRQHPISAAHHRRPVSTGGNAHAQGGAHPHPQVNSQGSAHSHHQGNGHPHPEGNAHHRRPGNKHNPPQGNADGQPQANANPHTSGNAHHPHGDGHGQSRANANPKGSSNAHHPQGNGNRDGQSQGGTSHPHGHGDAFSIHVVNQCRNAVDVGIFGVSSTYQAQQHGHTFNIPSGGSHILRAPFHATGLRLSAEAGQGPSAVFDPQLLFEFGHSEYQGVEGTSYDISMMNNANAQFGMAVHPLPNGHGSQTCESKICVPGNCSPSNGWTDPNQVNLGSPADTTCYKGKTNFQVIYCPNH